MSDVNLPDGFLATLASQIEAAGDPAGSYVFKWTPGGSPQLLIGDFSGGGTPAVVDQTEFVQATVTPGTNVNVNGDLDFNGNNVEEGNWTQAGSSLSYTGTPDYVEVSVVVPLNSSVQRAAPGLRMVRGAVSWPEVRSTYIRNSSGHNESTFVAVWHDFAPGTNPIYTFAHRQLASGGSAVTELVFSTAGHVTAKAVNRVSV